MSIELLYQGKDGYEYYRPEERLLQTTTTVKGVRADYEEKSLDVKHINFILDIERGIRLL